MKQRDPIHRTNPGAATGAALLTLLGALSLSSASLAADPEPVGQGTNAWLELQQSGTAASPAERPLPGEIADRSFQRYADSFSKPIPDSFKREGFLSDSGGGGGGGK